MAFDVGEIRDRAQRLKSAIALERYETRAGLKERSAFKRLYDDHQFLLAPQVLPAIQRELAEAGGDERRRLGSLFNWVAGQHVEAALAPLEDELRAWEAGATVVLADREVPLRGVEAAVARANRRGERLAWEAARNRRVEDAAALRLDILHREREAVGQLGMGTYVEARERLAGLNLRGLEREAVEILARTESAYREAFLREVGRRIGIESRSAARSDAVWLIAMRWLSQPFAMSPLLTRLRRDLEQMGLPLPRDGVVRMDLDRRPLKEGMSFCAAIQVPGDVVLVVSPVGGWGDARSLLHEIGHTLHFAYTSPALPWEDRALGDTAVTETFALVFECLTLDRGWVERTTGLSGSVLDEYLALAAFLQLYRVRRHAAQFLWEMELAAAERPGELASRYADLLGQATGFAHDPLTFIEDVRRGFWVARQLRSWMLSALMTAALHDRFGPQWYQDAVAGQFLGEILSEGQREDASQLATQLGEDRLTAARLLERFDRWLS